MPLVDLPEAALVSLMVLVWIAAAIVPDIWPTRRLSSLHTLFMRSVHRPSRSRRRPRTFEKAV